MELRIQLRGQLLDLVHQQRHDGLPEERHPNHRLQRFAERHPKTGITFQGGYDIKANKLTTSSVSITRDLHCWQMSFSWIPFGYHRSWSFNIGVKAASLSDLKYDKSQSMYDNMY